MIQMSRVWQEDCAGIENGGLAPQDEDQRAWVELLQRDAEGAGSEITHPMQNSRVRLQGSSSRVEA